MKVDVSKSQPPKLNPQAAILLKNPLGNFGILITYTEYDNGPAN